MRKYESQAKYDAANTRQINLKLNLKTDADILEQLYGAGNVQGYIKALIRADIAQKSGAVDNFVDNSTAKP